MFSALINRAAPEQVFISVMNNHTNTMSTGHAAVWDYGVGATTDYTNYYVTGGSGYGVTFARTTQTSWNPTPGLFAGIVAGRDIPPGDWGSVQVYGEFAGVLLTGISTAPWFGTAGQTAWNNTTLSTLFLRPCGVYNSTGAATNAGYCGIMSKVTTIAGTQTYASGDINMDLRPFWHGGYVLPLGIQYATNGTTSGTITYTSSCRIKGFIKCLN